VAFWGNQEVAAERRGLLQTTPHDKKKKKIVCKNTLLRNIKPGCQRT
jgi:hypothetical protein